MKKELSDISTISIVVLSTTALKLYDLYRAKRVRKLYSKLENWRKIAMKNNTIAIGYVTVMAVAAVVVKKFYDSFEKDLLEDIEKFSKKKNQTSAED